MVGRGFDALHSPDGQVRSYYLTRTNPGTTECEERKLSFARKK